MLYSHSIVDDLVENFGNLKRRNIVDTIKVIENIAALVECVS